MTQLRFGSNHWESVLEVLKDESGRERMAFLLCGRNGHGTDMRLLCHSVIPVDATAYQLSRADSLAVDPIFVNGVLNEAERGGWSVVMVHNHPGARSPDFSSADDYGESRLFPLIAGRMPDRVHGAMVVASDKAAFRTWRMGADRPERGRVVVLGKTLDSAEPDAGPSLAREALFIRKDIRQALAGVRVGIVGLGGTGSLVAQMLSHLRVGEVVLVDHDSMEASNLSRVVISRDSDVGKPKVSVAARGFRTASPTTRVYQFADSVFSREAIVALLSSDFIFACTDTHSSRLLLNQIAWQYLVPIVDIGALVRLDGAQASFVGGAVRVVMPGHMCLVCDQQIEPARITWELKSKDQKQLDRTFGYVPGFDAPEPAVISVNSVVAGIAVSVLLNFIGPFMPAVQGQMLVDLVRPTLVRTRPANAHRCEVCRDNGLIGSGELGALPSIPNS